MSSSFKGCNWWKLPLCRAEIMPIFAFSRVLNAQRISDNFGFNAQMNSKFSKHDIGLTGIHVLELLLCRELFFEIWISRIHLMLHNISLRMTLSKFQSFPNVYDNKATIYPSYCCDQIEIPSLLQPRLGILLADNGMYPRLLHFFPTLQLRVLLLLQLPKIC